MFNRKLCFLSLAGPFILCLGIENIVAQSAPPSPLPIGAGAIGRGPNALTPLGYEDTPRPPAFTAQVRTEVLRQNNLTDYNTPQPAFIGQTRAPLPLLIAEYEIEVVADDLYHPWSFNFLPDGRMLVAESDSGLRIVDQEGNPGEYIKGLPIDFSKRAQQLLDTIPDQNFADNHIIYFLYRVPPPEAGDIGRNEEGSPVHYPQIEMVGRGRLSEDETEIVNVEIILNTHGIEGRMIQAADGSLFITSGPLAGRGMLARNWKQSQQPGSLMGKILHINTDGSIPAENPYIGVANTRPEIWAFGVRDAQSIAFDPEGRLWTAENGPMGGDELNLIEPGKNYGFPIITYSREYNGELINNGLSAQEGLEQPTYFWTPSIAPSGMAFYTGDLFPQWQGNLFIAALAPNFGRRVVRLVLDETPAGWRVIGEEFLLADMTQGGGERYRDVKMGPDGALYVMTDLRGTSPGSDRILRLVPKSQ